MQKLFIPLLIGSFAAATLAASIGNPNNGKRLIKTSEQDPGKWLSEAEVLTLIQKGQGFLDITDFDYSQVRPFSQAQKIQGIPDTLRFNATVREAMTKVNTPREQEFLKTFSDFHTRYYQSDTGRASQLFLYSEVDASLRPFPGNSSAIEVNHGFLQRSIVARLEGADEDLKNEVIIIGAHIDSINGQNASFRSPGADDNGAGAVAVLEALKVIAEAGVVLKRSAEFHFYAAEEMGLWGSQAIAEDYRQKNVSVIGMLNLDVISHYAEGVNDIAIITDNGSEQLAGFVKLVTDGYLSWGLRERSCGYACSDHASWHLNNFPATMGIEAVSLSSRHHTENDTLDTVNFEQLNQFVHLAVGMIIEMGEPVNPL